jgi:glycine cleavage system aminomethyltransferase T
MGYVTQELASTGSEVGVLIRDKAIPAVVQRPPFYKDSSIRR